MDEQTPPNNDQTFVTGPAPGSVVDPNTTATPAAEPLISEVPVPASQPEPINSNSNHQHKILLVEDDESLANVYMTRLEGEGFLARRVKNGEDALASALEFRPDLIILDVMMPKISGFDVLDIIRNTPEVANVKIIMLTALSQEADIQRAKNLGVDDYLVKSQVVIADVMNKVKQHLGLLH